MTLKFFRQRKTRGTTSKCTKTKKDSTEWTRKLVLKKFEEIFDPELGVKSPTTDEQTKLNDKYSRLLKDSKEKLQKATYPLTEAQRVFASIRDWANKNMPGLRIYKECCIHSIFPFLKPKKPTPLENKNTNYGLTFCRKVLDRAEQFEDAIYPIKAKDSRSIMSEAKFPRTFISTM